MQSLADVVIVGRECHLVHGASDPIPRVHEAECLADRCEEAHLADGIEPRQIAAVSQTKRGHRRRRGKGLSLRKQSFDVHDGNVTVIPSDS